MILSSDVEPQTVMHNFSSYTYTFLLRECADGVDLWRDIHA